MFKAICSVIEDGVHYKGNFVTVEDNQYIKITGMFSLLLNIHDIRCITKTNSIVFQLSQVVIDYYSNQVDKTLTLRFLRENKAEKFIKCLARDKDKFIN